MNLTNEPEIIDLVESEAFIRKVRRASITLSDTSLITNEDIRESALGEAYPRIALIISAAKTSKESGGNPILGGIGSSSNYESQYREVRRVVLESPYSEGIHRVAIALTAALCIKQIPLNSDIKLLDLGKNIEEQALADLDRIMGLLNTIGLPSSGPVEEVVDKAIYLSSSLDLSSIPPTAFDRVINNSASINNVRTIPLISIPEDRVGVCWIYLTGNNQELDTGFFIEDGSSVEEVMELIAETINSATSNRDSGIVAAPNRGALLSYPLTYKKRDLYGEGEKELSFSINTRIHHISLESRYLSTTFDKELVSIKIYSLPIEYGDSLNTAIRNRYSKDCLPLEGLVYGIKPNYYLLSPRGPYSLVIDNEKQSAAADPSANKDEVNTFYFRLAEGEALVFGRLGIRISSPYSSDYTDWVIDLDNSSLEEVTFRIMETMYQRHLVSYILGSQPYPHAVEVVPYTRLREETRLVVAITELPTSLEVATGTSLNILTQYKPYPRSVVVKVVPDQTKEEEMPGPYGAISTEPYTKSPTLQRVYDKMDKLKSVRERHWYP